MVDRLEDRREIEGILRRNVPLHAYELGDLDDFYWPDTTWYSDSSRECVALVYAGATVMLYVDEVNDRAGRTLLARMATILPDRFVGHFSRGLADELMAEYTAEPLGPQAKMALIDTDRLRRAPSDGVARLGVEDLPDILNLYSRSYQENWFDPRMLETGFYFGIWRDSRLLTAAGVHVYSAVRRVAVLGNVATDPEYRGQGLASRTCARLGQELLETVPDIALDVAFGNEAALACYRRLGFSVVARYEKSAFARRSSSSAASTDR